MTTPTTATEAAQRLALDIYHVIGFGGNVRLTGDTDTHIDGVHISAVEKLIAAEIAPLVARAEAADRLAKAIRPFAESFWYHTNGSIAFRGTNHEQLNELLAAYRALAAEGQVQG